MIQPENIDLVYVVLASVGDEQFTKVNLPQDPVQILDPISFHKRTFLFTFCWKQNKRRCSSLKKNIFLVNHLVFIVNHLVIVIVIVNHLVLIVDPALLQTRAILARRSCCSTSQALKYKYWSSVSTICFSNLKPGSWLQFFWCLATHEIENWLRYCGVQEN